MGWAAGELERAELFYEQRRNRLEYRHQLMRSLDGDSAAFLDLLDRYEALWTSTLMQQPIYWEPDYPDTCPPTNQNVW